jgi:hypothetical protein
MAKFKITTDETGKHTLPVNVQTLYRFRTATASNPSTNTVVSNKL